MEQNVQTEKYTSDQLAEGLSEHLRLYRNNPTNQPVILNYFW